MSHQSELIAEDIHAYLKQHEDKQLLRLLTCGSVDDGKSTLIGRLLHDSKMIYEDQLEALHRDSKTQGTTGEAIDLALLVDGLQAEREQGITIDVAYRYFSTARRKFIIADTPGHEQYTRNMATGASNCELAIILIDARKGVLTQTRRHSFIVSLLGIRHVVVAINKMDLVDYSEAVFEQIKADYLAFAGQLDLPEVHFVPLSALKGDNVVSPSPELSWYQGLPLMELLESVDVEPSHGEQPLRFPVQYVNRPNLNFRGYCGTLASGKVQVGDAIRVLPSGQTSRVKSIVTWEGELASAFAPMAITLTLEDEIDISRGDLLVAASEQPTASDRLEAELVWMAEQPLVQGKTYLLKIGTRKVNARINAIHYKTEVNTLERHPASGLELNEIARVEILLEQPVVADAYRNNRATGSFILIDRLSKNTVAAGMVQGQDGQQQKRQQEPVSAAERALRLGQQPARIELRGADAVTRRELLQQLERALFDAGRLPLLLNEGELPAELARQQGALEQWLLHKGLLLLTASSGDQGELLAEISHQQHPQQLPLTAPEQAISLILQHLRQSSII
ncbi:sulfate adenylyltransferase subunit CysN [Marinospirillum alkaliphilum]|uniref:Sulfate adenylyltransferase subunit 1 n=1 Tax=Marinospirillum alkaliphilum DSM 21637 TaxID=1122209 RepID=A0A1K1YW45_9GAMM|nr:sulfate adenylyltransferase subunit CysN [Marinospirillum alkaliphilum]SFX66031.1 bifunctional enzyme CysN/CysC [Marinospirillum alkaliphilum DSM 21637]